MLRACFRLTRRLPFVGLLSRRLRFCQMQAFNAFESLKDVTFRGSLMSLVTVMIVWVAIFLYIAFYYAYMPSISHSRPIHLEFKSCQSSEVCSYPTAVVKLTRRQQLLMVGQPYKIVIHLDMPESPANRELGMFMVCAKLRNYDKCSSASSSKSAVKSCECSRSCRATMLHYRSPLLQALITLALSPFMIFGNLEEKQTIAVELYSEFEDDQNCPVTDIEVQILSQRVELYSAKLGIHAHLTGLRYLMYYWPITSAIVGVSCNLFFIFFIVSLSWWRLSQSDGFKDYQYNFSVVSYRKKEKENYEEVVHDEDTEESVMISGSETPAGTPKLKRRSKVSISADTDFIDDDFEQDIPEHESFEKDILSKESTA